MNKNLIKKILIILAILFAVIAISFAAYYFFDTSEYIRSASSVSPLGKKQQYIITGNLQTIDGNDGSVITDNTYYTFYPVGKEDERGTGLIFDKLIGRKINNRTTVDISEYLNKLVHIWGKFEYGLPILINQTTSSDLLSENVALTITKIELAE